jgi:hypothetical protein
LCEAEGEGSFIILLDKKTGAQFLPNTHLVTLRISAQSMAKMVAGDLLLKCASYTSFPTKALINLLLVSIHFCRLPVLNFKLFCFSDLNVQSLACYRQQLERCTGAIPPDTLAA